MDDRDRRDDSGSDRGKKKIGRQERRKWRTRKDGYRSWLGKCWRRRRFEI